MEQMERIQQRSFGKYILFTILSFGIYSIYFYYCLGRDINTLCEGDGKETPNYLIAILLSSATLGLYLKYWLYQQGERLHRNAPNYGYKMLEDGWHVLGLALIPSANIISTYVLLKNVNKMAERYNEFASAN